MLCPECGKTFELTWGLYLRALAVEQQSPSADLYLALARHELGAGRPEEAARLVREAPVPAWERAGMERELRTLAAAAMASDD